MSQKPTRAADLASLAIDSMWDALFDVSSADPLDGSVYVFFDVSKPPGREFAASALAHEGAMTQEDALAAVDATAAEAAAGGRPLGVGAFFAIADLVGVLERHVVDAGSRAELVRLSRWLERPVPLGYCRLVIVCGVELRASLARIAQASGARAAMPN